MTEIARNGPGTAAMAGVTGAVIGAGVAVAATKLMSDDKMRARVTDTMTHIKDQVLEAIDNQAQISRQVKKNLGKARNETSRMVAGSH